MGGESRYNLHHYKYSSLEGEHKGGTLWRDGAQSYRMGDGRSVRIRAGTGGKQRPKRKVPPQQYDETQRRGKRRRQYSHAYMESGKKRTHCNLKNAIVIGARTVERIVNGEYEWRDGGYKKNRREGALFHERGEHDPG